MLTILVDYDLAALLIWCVALFFMYYKGLLGPKYSRWALIAVASTVGYVALILVGVLGAGYARGWLLPRFDALLAPFILFYVGVPIVGATILIGYIWHVFSIRKLELIPAIFIAASLYLLFAVWTVFIEAVSSV